jgi:hypothetical protein
MAETVTPAEEITMKLGSKLEEAVRYQKAHFCLKDLVLPICPILDQIIASGRCLQR